MFYWFRIIIMIIGLIGIIWTIHNLNQNGLDKNLYGFNESSTDSSTKSLNWCPTRVREITVSNQLQSLRVFQTKGVKWFLQIDNQDPLVTKVPYMEKWLSENCTTNAIVSKLQEPLKTRVHQVSVKFVDGTTSAFVFDPNGALYMNGTKYLAPELTEALENLSFLPTN